MTIDEAIQHCEEVAKTNERICATELRVGLPDIYYHKDEAKKCASEHRQLAEWLKELKAYKEQSGDAISRADARHLIAETNRKALGYISTKVFKILYDGIDKLPSVTPQQRTGRWVKEGQGGRYKWMCSNCGTHHRALYDYCPSCGCKMEVEE